MTNVMFDRQKLLSLIVCIDTMPEGETVCIVDYALTDGPRADNTALLAARVAMVSNAKHYWITEIRRDRWSQSETAYQVSHFIAKHNPARTHIERLSGHELLKAEIYRQAERYGTEIRGDIVFFKPSKKPDAKKARIKQFFDLCEAGVVHFVGYTDWTVDAFDEMCRYSGERKNRGRKDDAVDVCGYLAQFG